MAEPVHILEGGVPDLVRRARLGRRGGRERARCGPVAVFRGLAWVGGVPAS